MTALYDWATDGLGDDPDQEVVTEPETVTTDRPVDPPEHPRVWATVTNRTDTNRRPILPAWARSRKDAYDSGKFVLGNAAHTLVYHGTRMPKYTLKMALWAPVGLARVLAALLRWVADLDGRVGRDDEARRLNPDGTRRLAELHDQHVRHRLWIVLVATVALATLVVVVWLLAPGWVPWAALALLLATLARVGRPADRPLLDTAVVVPRFRKLTAEAVRRALCSLGIAAMKTPDSITFPAEISRDGPGYLATVDLPHGVTTAEVLDRRPKLASALRVPVDQCWPETVPGQHAGRLALWVADEPVSAMRQPAWPLAKNGTVDLFDRFPFGTDPRKRPVKAGLIWRNWLLGGIPGSGKSGALRLLLLAAALDQRVELRGYELKGSGDLDMLEPVCSEYGSGPDDDTAEEALGMLRWARRECSRRAEVIKRMAKAGKAPEHKVTPQLAAVPDLGLHPVVLFLDEMQELMLHDRYGTEAGQLATSVIKLGRALGVVLVLATQRPDKDSLPTGVSANVNTRYALRVMGQTENDMILGTSMYKAGVRSTQWSDRDLGWGWLVGVGDPVACHVYYVDGEQATRVVARAVALRGGPTRPAERPAAARYDLIADVRAVWVDGDDATWSEKLAARLAQLRPEVYDGWDVATLNAALRAAGVEPGQVHRKIDGRGYTRHGIRAADLDSARPAIARSPASPVRSG